MIRKSTRWDRKERVNVESDLEFAGTPTTKHISIPLGSAFNFGTSGFSYSLNVEPNGVGYISQTVLGSIILTVLYSSISGIWTILIFSATENISLIFNKAKNEKTNLIVTYDGIAYKAFLNGKEEYSVNSGFPNTANFDLSGAPFRIGNRLSLASITNGTISNYSWFNRALTPQEISYIHTQGGLIPESAHESCVAHYPLTQRQYFKASADFIIKHPQFALNDLIALDVVGQYNYAKPTGPIASFSDAGGGEVTATDVEHGLTTGNTVNITDTANYDGSYIVTVLTADTFKFTAVWVATETGNWNQYLTANHGELINFTDAEVNTLGTSSIKDFYNKEPLLSKGVFCEQIVNGGDSWERKLNNTTVNLQTITTAFTAYCKFIIKDISVIDKDYGLINFGVGLLRFSVENIRYNRNGGLGQADIVNYLALFREGENTMFWHIPADGNPANITVFINGQSYPIAVVSDTGTTPNIELYKTIGYDLIGGRKIYTNLADQVGPFESEFLGVIEAAFYNDALTDTEMEEIVSNKLVQNVKCIDHLAFYKMADDGSYTTEILGVGWQRFERFNEGGVGATFSNLDSAFIEKDSLLPEIRQAFFFNNGVGNQAITFPNYAPSNESGFTFAFTFIGQPTSTDFIYDVIDGTGLERFVMYVGVDGSLTFYRTSNDPLKDIPVFSTTASFVGKSFDEINLLEIKTIGTSWKAFWNGVEFIDNVLPVALDLSDFGAVNTILVNRNDLARPYTSKMIFMGIKKGVTSAKSSKKIFNNSLLNPNLENWDIYFNPSEGNHYDDGADVRLKNLGSLGDVFDGKTLGLTGATSADQLLDVPNHLIDINELM